MSYNIVNNLNILQNVRNDMKLALENKGQTVNTDIRTFANAISNISGGQSVINLPSNLSFYRSYELTNVPDWWINGNFNGVNRLENTFYATNLQVLNLSNKDISNVETMDGICRECRNLNTLDLSNLNLNNTDIFSNIAFNCYNLLSANLSNLNIKAEWSNGYQFIKWTNSFANCYNLQSVDLSNLNLINTISNNYDKGVELYYSFANCYNLVNLNLSNIKAQYIALVNTFVNCQLIENINLNCFNRIDNINNAFYNCYNVINIEFNNSSILYSATNAARLNSVVENAFSNCFNISNNTLENITNLFTRTQQNSVNQLNGLLSKAGLTENQCMYIANLNNYKNVLKTNGWLTGYSNIDNAGQPDAAFLNHFVSVRLSDNFLNALNGYWDSVIEGDTRYIIIGGTSPSEGESIEGYEYYTLDYNLTTIPSSITSTTNITSKDTSYLLYDALKDSSDYYISFVATEMMEDPGMGPMETVVATSQGLYGYTIDISNSNAANYIIMLDYNPDI